MKNYLSLLFISILLFCPAFPQTFGIGGGLSTIQEPDEYTNDINTAGLRFSNGYHIGAILKLSIPQSPITPISSLTYSGFSSSQSTYLGNLKVSQSIWTLAAGVEYKLLYAPLSPYFSTELEYSDFGDPEVEGYYPILQPIPVRDESGFGLAIGIGAEFTILPGIGLDASIKYNFFDLVAKKWETEPVSALSYNLTLLFL